MLNSTKGFRNIAANIFAQIVTILLGIIIPRLMLVNLGSEANGLFTSIGNVLVYVALLEAGVGTAATQALYAPIATKNRQRVNEIVAAVDHFYKRTGRWYFAVILLLTFAFPFTLDSTLPKWQIMTVMFLSGMPGVIKYYYQGKYVILLRADGRSYALTNLSIVVNIATSAAKIALLLFGCNIVELQAMYLLFNVAQVFFILIYVKRHYPWLRKDVTPDYEAISQSKNALVHQISSMIFFNTDVLLLTYFCGLKTVSVYSMYTMLFGIISSAILNFAGANFILGQTFNTDRERSLKLLDVYELFNMVLTFSLFCIANIFILPFMTLYTSGITDIDYVDQYLPYLIVATNLLSNGRNSSSQIIEYAEHFKQTQWRSILESVINIVVSLVCVFQFGIYGVLLGTIAALLYRTNDMIIYANKKILHRSPWKTYRRWLVNLALFVVVTMLSKLLFTHILLNTYPRIILWAAITCIIVIPLFFAVASIFDRETYRHAKELVTPYLKRVWNKLRGHSRTQN